jgi:transposase
LTRIDYDYADGKNREIAQGFEKHLTRTVTVDGNSITWNERQLVVRSHQSAIAQEQSLRQRLQKTAEALRQLTIPRRGKKKLISLDQWQAAVATILKRYRSHDFFQIEFQLQRVQTVKRAYLNRPSQTVEEISIYLEWKIDEDAVNRQINLFGWRVYVTNQVSAHFK